MGRVRNKRYLPLQSFSICSLPLFLFFFRIPKTLSSRTVKISHSRGKCIINWTRRFHARIDKPLPSCRNLISAISLSLFLPSFVLSFSSFHHYKRASRFLADFHEDTSYGISTRFLRRAGIFRARFDCLPPKAGCDVRHEKFSPIQFLRLVNSLSFTLPRIVLLSVRDLRR